MRKVWNALASRVLKVAGRHAYETYVPTYSSALRNAVAYECLANVARCGVPRTLKAWNNRQCAIADNIAAATGLSALEILPVVARVFPVVCPRVYNVPKGELLARYNGNKGKSTPEARKRASAHASAISVASHYGLVLH